MLPVMRGMQWLEAMEVRIPLDRLAGPVFDVSCTL